MQEARKNSNHDNPLDFVAEAEAENQGIKQNMVLACRAKRNTCFCGCRGGSGRRGGIGNKHYRQVVQRTFRSSNDETDVRGIRRKDNQHDVDTRDEWSSRRSWDSGA